MLLLVFSLIWFSLPVGGAPCANTHPPMLLPSELLNPESTLLNSTIQYDQLGYQLTTIIEVQFTGTGTTVSNDRVGYASHMIKKKNRISILRAAAVPDASHMIRSICLAPRKSQAMTLSNRYRTTARYYK
jgi:hypothetical protein